MVYPPALSAIIGRASDRVYARLASLPAYLAQRSRAWLDTFTQGHSLGAALQAPQSFPLVLPVWWAEESFAAAAGHPGPDVGFQEDLVYSSLQAYLFVRLLDDVMDADADADPKLLPLAGVLHQEFQSTLARWFPEASPFWTFFRRLWDESASVTVQDADAASLTEAEFLAISGRKCLGAAIQVGAVCFHYGRTDVLEPWTHLVEALSVWHQFGHDLFDWKKDQEAGLATFYLAEADRQRAEGESVDGWVYRQGFAWGRGYRNALTQGLRDRAADLGSPGLVAYLDGRQELDDQRFETIESGLALARALFGIASS